MRTEGCVTVARCESAPTRPPTKTSTPGTMPVAGASALTMQPMRPMSATCTWPQLLGQPVHIMRMSRGSSSTLSRCSATRHAVCFVSIWLKPQNWLPVQATRPPMRRPGNGVNAASSGSASSAATRSVGTPAMMKFCSTVRRTSPLPYASARSPSAARSAASMRPPGTEQPTQCSPACFCACTPR